MELIVPAAGIALVLAVVTPLLESLPTYVKILFWVGMVGLFILISLRFFLSGKNGKGVSE
jgi:hypothetical protein